MHFIFSQCLSLGSPKSRGREHRVEREGKRKGTFSSAHILKIIDAVNFSFNRCYCHRNNRATTYISKCLYLGYKLTLLILDQQAQDFLCKISDFHEGYAEKDCWHSDCSNSLEMPTACVCPKAWINLQSGILFLYKQAVLKSNEPQTLCCSFI